MDFKQAYDLKIGKHVEKKGRFSYLSWVFAVKYLRENFPEAQWIIHETEDKSPCFKVPVGYMVKVSVMVEGQPYTQWHPVLNHQNKPIPEPNSFEINTSIQRCLTKAIGLATGIGLALYAGEDLPKEEKEVVPITETQAKKVKTLIAKTGSDIEKLLAFFKVDSVDSLTVPQFTQAVTMLSKKEAA